MAEGLNIYQTFTRRRRVGFLMVLLGIPATALWAMIAWPPNFSTGYLVFLLGGPGFLGLGLWAAFWPVPPRLRIRIEPAALYLYPGISTGPEVRIALSDLTSVTQTGLSNDTTRLRFAATTGTVDVQTAMLDHHPTEIIRLITIQLENLGKHLSQTSSPVLGAPSGVWEIRDGVPFKDD